jgi:hypothetical protein
MKQQTAAGPFDVKMVPQTTDDPTVAGPFGRMLLDKRFHGDIEATSNGQMLAGRTTTDGSAAYVAMEAITGTVHGKTGSFWVHHTGVMDRGAQSLQISVVPDSGTGELTGIRGTMQITIEGKAHFYTLEYTLPE